jgi:hypothetical protein
MNRPKDKDRIHGTGYQPPLGHRLFTWFGLYLCGAAPIAFWVSAPGTLLGFPWGLLYIINYVFYQTNPLPESTIQYIYAGYAVHLLLSLLSPSFKLFHFLKSILVIAILVNLAGCAMIVHTLPHARYFDLILGK